MSARLRLLVALVTVLLCAACGPGPSRPAPSTTAAPSTVVAPPPSSAPPTTTTAPPVTTTTGPATTTTAPPATTPAPAGRAYPWHTDIVATTFWVGEIFDPRLPDGSQVCSTYDSQWAYHWSGVNAGKVPASAGGCQGATVGGCDGVPSVDKNGAQTAAKCDTEARKAPDYWPTKVAPRENPFYLDLPFDDVNDPAGFKSRCQVIPWAGDPGFAGKCKDGGFSYMKNRWVHLVGPSGRDCYGQIEDAGPSHGSLYHDAAYVFGADNRQPVQGQFNNAGADVSPALNGCLGFAELDGDGDKIRWQFVDQPPAGPWTRVVTTTPFTP